MNRLIQASRSCPQPCSPEQPCADIPRRSLGMFQPLLSWTENGVAAVRFPLLEEGPATSFGAGWSPERADPRKSRGRQAAPATSANGMVRPRSCPVSDRSWQGAVRGAERDARPMADQGRICPAPRNSRYHSGRESITSEPAAASLTRVGLVVPRTTCMRAGCRKIQAMAIPVGVTPCVRARSSSASFNSA
jgi:hypothetical protein